MYCLPLLYISLPEAIQVHLFNGKRLSQEGSELDRRAELRGDPGRDPSLWIPGMTGESTEMVI